MMRHKWARFLGWAVLFALIGVGPVSADAPYVHTYTGFTFPPKVATFSRVRITPYNEAHSDIEVDYDNHPFTVHLAVYVYPAHDPLKVHDEQCKADVVKVHPDAQLCEEKPVTLIKSGSTYKGLCAWYAFRDTFVGNKEQTLFSQVILFQRGAYDVLFRISYARADEKAAEAEIAAFMDALVWPPGDKPAPSP